MSELERDNTDAPAVVYTTRVPCRSCGRSYALPKGTASPPAGIGPCCQLSLTAYPFLLAPIGVVELVDVELERAPARDIRWLGLDDVLCEACRERMADGRLTPGVPLCVACADETLEHWLAWLIDPSHDWWPDDDPFGSARYPVKGRRDMEAER